MIVWLKRAVMILLGGPERGLGAQGQGGARIRSGPGRRPGSGPCGPDWSSSRELYRREGPGSMILGGGADRPVREHSDAGVGSRPYGRRGHASSRKFSSPPVGPLPDGPLPLLAEGPLTSHPETSAHVLL